MDVELTETTEAPSIDELLLRLERESQSIMPREVLSVLLEPLRELASTAAAERDEAIAEAALNRFEDVLEAFVLGESISAS
jgi:hypothetical protein